MTQRLPLSIALESRKVYVGWPTGTPEQDPRKDIEEAYITLLPIHSGYRNEKNLELSITTRYSQVYQRMIAGEEFVKADGTKLSVQDFEIVLPLAKIVSVSQYAIESTQPS